MLVSRTGMSFREAKLELKVRGFINPARNPVYKSKLRNVIPQKTREIYNNHEVNTNELKAIENDQDGIVSKNFFGILRTTDVEIHQESSHMDDTDSDQALPDNKVEIHESKQIKRTYDKVSPVKSSTSSFSTRPKIQRNTKIIDEIIENKATYTIDNQSQVFPSPIFSSNSEIVESRSKIDNTEEISSSPIFPTKFKNPAKSKSIMKHGPNCNVSGIRNHPKKYQEQFTP